MPRGALSLYTHSQGTYKPHISPRCCTWAKVQQNIYVNQDFQRKENFPDADMTEEEVDDLLWWTPRLAANTSFQWLGEIPIVGFNEEIRKNVESKL